MTKEQARELFSAAFEDELDAEAERAFAATLAADPALAAEYEQFAAMLRGLRPDAEAGARTPNLLPGVQERLRARSRGRFYADRFAQRTGMRIGTPLVLGLVMLTVLALAFFGLHFLQGVTPPH